MKQLFLSLLLAGTVYSQPKTPVSKDVYICNSGTAYVYHSTTSCSGLNKCTHEIIAVSLSEAINKYGRRACKICD